MPRAPHKSALFAGNPRAKFNTGDGLPATADAWLKGSAPHQGSWWEHWAKWLEARSGDRVTAPKELGNETYKVRAAAPGSYVHG